MQNLKIINTKSQEEVFVTLNEDKDCLMADGTRLRHSFQYYNLTKEDFKLFCAYYFRKDVTSQHWHKAMSEEEATILRLQYA